jgi:predicted nucleotidyltransferase
MNAEALLAEKRDEILRLARKHGARNVRVFGSTVRHEDTPDSDIDLLVEAGPERAPFFPGGLLADLEALLDRHVDIMTENGLHWYIRKKVLQEARPL